MKFVIWGAGYRGRKILDFLGRDRIVAFIDNDEKLSGTEYCGIPVIDFKAYQKLWNQYFIIVSPLEYHEIVEFLMENHIVQYFELSNCPSELVGSGTKQLFDKFPIKFNKNECNVVYGINLFSLLVYEYLSKEGCTDVYLVPQNNYEEKVYEIVAKKLNSFKTARWSEVECLANKVLLVAEEDEQFLYSTKKGAYIIENCFDFSTRIDEYYNPAIEKFKNIHSGKRCFIVATGPSLTMEDLTCLDNHHEICFSMNQIFYAFPNTKWRPQYYFNFDKKYIENYEDDIIKLDTEHKFIADYAVPFWNHKHANNIYKVHNHNEPYINGLPKFSDDVSRRVYVGYTVTYTCIQMAIYMGFREIYLLGVDFNYSKKQNSTSDHFSDKYLEKVNIRDFYNYEKTKLAYEKAQKYACEHGVEIYNATRGGKLEVFERVNFDDLFKSKLGFNI